jgi:hypothetical protein
LHEITLLNIYYERYSISHSGVKLLDSVEVLAGFPSFGFTHFKKNAGVSEAAGEVIMRSGLTCGF